jgi:hypothetical protein
VAEREHPQPPGEGDLAVVVEGLLAQEHHLVREQRPADLGDGFVGKRLADVHTPYLGADVPSQPGDLNTDRGSDAGRGHVCVAFLTGWPARANCRYAAPGCHTVAELGNDNTYAGLGR